MTRPINAEHEAALNKVRGLPVIAELTQRYGTGTHPGVLDGTPIGRPGGTTRSAWVWLVHGKNWNLAIDRCVGCTWPWKVTANADGRHAEIGSPSPPSHDQIRAVAVAAGLLPAAGGFSLSIKTTSDTHHVLWFSSAAARDAFVADMGADGSALMLAHGYDLSGGNEDAATT